MRSKQLDKESPAWVTELERTRKLVSLLNGLAGQCEREERELLLTILANPQGRYVQEVKRNPVMVGKRNRFARICLDDDDGCHDSPVADKDDPSRSR